MSNIQDKGGMQDTGGAKGAPGLKLDGKVTPGLAPAGPGANEKVLFWASFLTLIAAGMGAAIRGDILNVWGQAVRLHAD